MSEAFGTMYAAAYFNPRLFNERPLREINCVSFPLGLLEMVKLP